MKGCLLYNQLVFITSGHGQIEKAERLLNMSAAVLRSAMAQTGVQANGIAIRSTMEMIHQVFSDPEIAAKGLTVHELHARVLAIPPPPQFQPAPTPAPQMPKYSKVGSLKVLPALPPNPEHPCRSKVYALLLHL
jgi:hypothetical protein